MTRVTIKMQLKIFLVLAAISLTPMVWSRTRKAVKTQDALSRARCDLTCSEVEKENKGQCRTDCRTQEVKPGTCPNSDSPQWAAACVEACNMDSQCDGTQRCCHHGCGSTCSEPLDLQTLPGLPALPSIEEIKERHKSVAVRWTNGVGDAARAVPGRILYLLEEQHHLGPKFEEPRLGEWNLILRTNKTKVSLKNLLKSGRWYRFRVASISASGTRGFSAPSAPFTPRKGPRPPPRPKKVKVHPMRADNGTVTVKLDWKEPRSDLPIIKYKVFWSRRVRGLGGELDSVLVNHQTVPKNQRNIEIKDLQPNSMYFFQVQTISQFGLSKLRSDKSAVFYNTTSGINKPSAGHEDDHPESLQKREKKINNLKLHRVIWYNHKLKAKISWDSLPKSKDHPRRYYIHWRSSKCDNPEKQNKEFSATTEKALFEIYELEYHCSYKVNVNRSRKAKTADSELTVIVPGCEYFQQRVNSTKIDCNV